MDAITTYRLTYSILGMMKIKICKFLFFLFQIEIKISEKEYYPFFWIKFILKLFSKTTILEIYFNKTKYITINCSNRICEKDKWGPINGGGVRMFGNFKDIGLSILYYKDSKQFRTYFNSEPFRSLRNNYIFSISEGYRNEILKDVICNSIIEKKEDKINKIFSDLLEEYIYDAEDRSILLKIYG